MERISCDIAVLGAGPGGYAAAFYAADRGKKVVLVDQVERLGGVCLQHGCIPSKALLNAAHLLTTAREAGKWGLAFEPPRVDLDRLRSWKDSVVGRLTQGLDSLCRARGVTFLRGRGYFEGSTTLRVETGEGQKLVTFDKAVVAVGSSPALPKALDLGNPRIMTSTEALALPEVPEELLVVGGGYIGLELGTVYAALGSHLTLVEATGSILPGVDEDLARPVLKAVKEKVFRETLFDTRVKEFATDGKKIKATLEREGRVESRLFDRVLVAVGRTPNRRDLGLENTKAAFDDKGFIRVDKHQATDDPSLYAIGDVVGGLMLAHKAAREARVAVDSILGEPAAFDSVVPCVVFTDPEVAWCGVTEGEAKKRGIEVEVSRFPWAASGRALTLDRGEGLTKLVVERTTGRILGVGLVGAGAGELIGEGVLAVEMGATVGDLAGTIHAHPTLSETLMESAEAYFGLSTHSLPRRKAT